MSATPELIALDAQLRQRGQARTFVSVTRSMLRHDDRGNLVAALEKDLGVNDMAFFTKAAVTAQTFAEVWQSGRPLEMAARYLESIADASILDAVRPHATLLPDVGHLVVGTGVTANVIAEGAPKIVQHLDFTGAADAARIKCAAMIVFSKEVARAEGFEAGQLFERELKAAVVAASNAAFIGALAKTAIATTGSAVGDLTAGIKAADNSTAYVVAASWPLVHELALASEGRMGIAGGFFTPGVQIIGYDVPPAGAPLTVIPASRIGLSDWGMEVRNASHASVEMETAPANPTTASTVLLSLWQNNLVAIMVERLFRVVPSLTAKAVEVG